MVRRTTITLDDDNFAFLETVSQGNRSSYINHLLEQEKQRVLQQQILKANQEEAEDLIYQEELADWDVTLADGLSQ